MRKRVLQFPAEATYVDPVTLDLEKLASVEVTSEEQAHPIERALLRSGQEGWRSATPGAQTIRMCFDQPQNITRISLEFEEHERERTQEFVLRWTPGFGQPLQQIVRQQWNFSPAGSVYESETYAVQLPGAKVLELLIVPDISGGEARASLKRLRLA